MLVVLRLNEAAAGWSDEETVRRWGKLFPSRGKDRQPLEVTNAWVEDRAKDANCVAEFRKRPNDLSWLMKRAVRVAVSSYCSETDRRFR